MVFKVHITEPLDHKCFLQPTIVTELGNIDLKYCLCDLISYRDSKKIQSEPFSGIILLFVKFFWFLKNLLVYNQLVRLSTSMIHLHKNRN